LILELVDTRSEIEQVEVAVRFSKLSFVLV